MSDPRFSEHKQILFLNGNDVKGASDYTAADIHGSMKAFSGILNLMTHPGDRLFLGGDLVDRGNDNVEVIRTIVERNQSSEGGIYCVLGNHEKMCLNTIDALNDLIKMKLSCAYMGVYLNLLRVKNPDTFDRLYYDDAFYEIFSDIFDEELEIEINDISHYFVDGLLKNEDFKSQYDVWLRQCNSAFHHLSTHRSNGGKWLINLYMDEFDDEKILYTQDKSLYFVQDSDVKMIYDYMSKLPIVIRVKKTETVPAYNIVHADMPVGDKKLEKLYDANRGLSNERQEYALWARSEKMKPEIVIDATNKRDYFSTLTYTGHSPFDGVREKTNTINLDVRSTCTGMALVVNHTKMECIVTNATIVENNGKKEYLTCNEDIDNVFNATQKQLNLQKQLQPVKSNKKKSKSGANS